MVSGLCEHFYSSEITVSGLSASLMRPEMLSATFDNYIGVKDTQPLQIDRHTLGTALRQRLVEPIAAGLIGVADDGYFLDRPFSHKIMRIFF